MDSACLENGQEPVNVQHPLKRHFRALRITNTKFYESGANRLLTLDCWCKNSEKRTP